MFGTIKCRTADFPNFEITKVELFDFSIFELIFNFYVFFSNSTGTQNS